jgi:hypothetical protein
MPRGEQKLCGSSLLPIPGSRALGPLLQKSEAHAPSALQLARFRLVDKLFDPIAQPPEIKILFN